MEYLLAPEQKFPTPLNDCLAAYQWMISEADALGIDTKRLAIGGTSAGGNLAAALLLVARDEGLPMPTAQMLDAPCLDLTLALSSMNEMGDGFGLTRSAVEEFVSLYVEGAADRSDPLVSPLLASDLTGLPPAVVLTSEFDPVRDDGERWIAKLHQAGVPGTCFRVLSHFHAAWIIPATVAAGLVSDLKASVLRRAFAGKLVPNTPW